VEHVYSKHTLLSLKTKLKGQKERVSMKDKFTILTFTSLLLFNQVTQPKIYQCMNRINLKD